MDELIQYGKKNMFTLVCEHVIKRVRVREGWICVGMSRSYQKEFNSMSI